MDTSWARVGTLQELCHTGRLVVRPEGRQLALFKSGEDIFACNNRCPHEGYPLSEGSLDGGCTLTCNWHNWKFDLRSGDNFYGGDRLRTYPVQIRGEQLWVDLTDPPFEERRCTILANLKGAFEDNDYARMAREVGRLHRLGANPLDAVRAAIGWSYERMEFGWTHAYAGVADWLDVHDEHPDNDEILIACVLEGIAHIADDVLREDTYPFTRDAADYDEDAFVAAIEREDETTAVAMLRGALLQGTEFAALEAGLARAALAHYNAFGHSAIYVSKSGRLIQRLGHEVAQPLLQSLVRGIVFARREDLIPEFRRYAGSRKSFGHGGNGAEPRADAWLGCGIDRSLEETLRVSAAPAPQVFDALLGANAHNLLHFELSRQGKVRIPINDNINWLDFTHAITFAAAVRELCERHPQLWPDALLQLACFCGRNTRYTSDTEELSAWTVPDAGAFFGGEIERILDHEVDEFIVSVHRLKTLLAARELIAAGLGEETESTMLAGVNRYLYSATRLKQVRRTVYQALQFVARDG